MTSTFSIWSDINDMAGQPKVGDIAVFNLNPVKGHEIMKTRPCLILAVPTLYKGSPKAFNIAVIVPLTSAQNNYWTEIPISKKGKMDSDSFVLCHQIRALDLVRAGHKLAEADNTEMKRVRQVLKIMLGT